MIHTPDSIDINNRKEYLRWCKDTAIEYIKHGSIETGIEAFCEVIEKAATTKDIANNGYIRAALSKKFENNDKAIEFIEGWN